MFLSTEICCFSLARELRKRTIHDSVRVCAHVKENIHWPRAEGLKGTGLTVCSALAPGWLFRFPPALGVTGLLGAFREAAAKNRDLTPNL